jgi:cation diffusion facilitator family transporter
MPRITKTGALKISFVAIVTAIIVEGLAGLLVGSLALMSDAAHAAFDALSTLILLVATSLSLKPADEDHTYGHGKIETLGTLIGGVALIVLAGTIMVLAAYRLTFGSTIQHTSIGLAAAGYTLAVDFLRMGVLSAASKTGSSTIRAGLYAAVSDFASTVIAILGLGLAILGYPGGDAVASMILAIALGYTSIRLVYSSSLELSDAISGKLIQSILKEIRRTDEVLKVKELRARRVGEMTYVDAIVAVSPYAKLADADTVASRIEANLTRLLGEATVLIHIEPLDWDVPVELHIRNATGKVDGVRGLHNLSVTNIAGDLYVTLHVQVDPSLPLDKAHDIAESVEKGIGAAVAQVRQVTVHLEPSLPEQASGTIVDDQYVSGTVRSIIGSYREVVAVNSILAYSTSNVLHINIHCLFAGDESISKIHDMVTKVEESIRQKFSEAVVTIHAEPVSSKRQIPTKAG